jgi:hypothetical protein
MIALPSMPARAPTIESGRRREIPMNRAVSDALEPLSSHIAQPATRRRTARAVA